MAEQDTCWDLGRLVRTLLFFQVLPWLEAANCPVLTHWLTSYQHKQAPAGASPSFGTPQLSQVAAGTMPAAGTGPECTGSEKIIFDFRQPQNTSQGTSQNALQRASLWGALDDVVMGGVSSSQFRLQAGRAVFSGRVSTANSGGFASVRTRNMTPPLNLNGFEGIELTVQGDGNRYKFFLRSDERWDGVGYAHSFDTQPGQWQTVRIPFSAFVPVFRARRVADAPTLNRARISSLQLMLSKFEYDQQLNPKFTPGEFTLAIATIKAYGSSSISQP